MKSKARLRSGGLLLAALSIFALGCSRGNSVYSDPGEATARILPIGVDDVFHLPKDFVNQSVNGASVSVEADGGATKAIRFLTKAQTNPTGGFNGNGQGNRALLGLSTWNSRPLTQAEPVTFDSKILAGSEKIAVHLQLDLKCDGTQIYLVTASGDAIFREARLVITDAYSRLTASIHASLWLSATSAIVDPDTNSELVPVNGTPVALDNLIAKFPAACLKNAATTAADFPRGVSTSAISWSLGDSSTTNSNIAFVRRLTVGSELYEGLE